jgi:hypothetical protein
VEGIADLSEAEMGVWVEIDVAFADTEVVVAAGLGVEVSG